MRQIDMRMLYEHQNDAINHMIDEREGRWVSVVGPTGNGKTVTAQVVANILRSRGKHRKIIFGISAGHIEDAFALAHLAGDVTAAEVWGYKPNETADTIAVTLRPGDYLRLRDEKGTATDAFYAFMQGNDQRVALTSHALLARLCDQPRDRLPPDLTGCVLLLDECHHKGFSAPKGSIGEEFDEEDEEEDGEGSRASRRREGTRLYEFADLWYKLGGTVLTLTATPFRTDGNPIAPPGVVPFVITHTQLALRGISYRRAVIRLIARKVLKRPYNVLLNEDYETIARHTVESRKPTVIRVPRIAMAGPLKAALMALGLSEAAILVTTGKEEKKGTFQQIILRERQIAYEQGYEATTVHVIITCMRMGEGLDWPICARVVCVGLPISIVMVAQLLGRAARAFAKRHLIPGYPADWIDDVEFVAYVPDILDDATAARDQAQRLLHIACTLECSDVALDIQHLWEKVVRGFRLPPGSRVTTGDLINLGGLSMDEEADATLLGVKVTMILRDLYGRAPTWREVAKYLQDHDGTQQSLTALVKLLEAMARDNEELMARYKASLQGILVDTVRRAEEAEAAEDEERGAAGGPPGSTNGPTDSGSAAGHKTGPRTRLAQAYADVLREKILALADEFGDTLVNLDEHILGHLTGILSVDPLDGRPTIADLVRAAEKARNDTYDIGDEDAAEIIHSYIEAYGVFPSLLSGEQSVSALIGNRCSLRQVDAALRRQGFDFGRLAVCYKQIMRPDLDLNLLRAKLMGARVPMITEALWANPDALARSLRDPRYSLKRYGLPDENLVALELCFRRGWRGCRGGETLAQGLASSVRLPSVGSDAPAPAPGAK